MPDPQRRVRFNDVNASYLEQREEIDAAIQDVLQHGDYINGRAVRSFEKAFAAYCGTEFAIGCANGTAALHIALTAAGIQAGDEVIVPAMTFIATSEAVTHAGAKIVFADINPVTLNLDAESMAAAINKQTRAAIFVHLHGNTTGIMEVAEVCSDRHLHLIEDCAQAHGARIATGNSRAHPGTVGIAGTFSFFPAKNVGAFGDAGAVVTNDSNLALTARRFANHGREEKYRHLFEGHNYRLDTLQAAVLDVKLRKLDEHVLRRNRLAAIYEERLNGCDLTFQAAVPNAVHARHLFVIQVKKRDLLIEHLKHKGIESGIHYPIALHLQPAYAHLGYKRGQLPVAEATANTTLSLPLYPQMPEDDVHYVCDAVCEFFANR